MPTTSPSASESATLQVRLLGGMALRHGEAPVPPLQSARAESLLAYLLLHRDAPQPRQHLAFVLWPDSTESQARTNLRHVLHHLRRTLPDADRFVEVGPRTLRWRPQVPVWLDVAVFEEAVAEGRWEEAVGTYTGDLLEGSYDDWVLEERERLAQLHVGALERLARVLGERGRLPDAIRYAERLVRQDPLREEGYRLLLRLWGASGDRARALRVYHECAGTLRRELGVDPAAATRAAYEALLETGPGKPGARAGGPAPAADPVAAARPPLVGRAAEWARLTALWREAERGSARFVLVTGEAGVGKTRLVEELRSWCAHAGAVAVEARAYPAEGTMAYGTAVTWMRSDPIARRLRRLDRPRQTELARLLPELLTEVPRLAAPRPLPREDQRQRIFEALAGAILAAGAPLLLAADDLQWCDLETLRFLHYLLRAEPEARLLVAATARREDIDPHHPVNRLVTGLETLGRLFEVTLDRLSRDETGVLAGWIAGRTLGDAETDRVYAHSEGNPLFVVEAMRADAAGTPPGTAAGSRGEAVIASRLAQLSGPAAELLGVAALIGRAFTADVLAEASGASEPDFVRALDELWRRGLVRAHAPRAYDFSHDKIREAAYRALGPAKAAHHHKRIARAFERINPGAVDAVSGEIAWHYDAAGAAREAIHWYERAAEAAQRLHASADAVRLLERALELVSGLAEGPERAALELRLLTALPAPLVAVHGYLSARVREVHERALDLGAGLGAQPAAPLIRSVALATLTRGDFEAARPFGAQLRRRAEREGDEVLWVESAYVLGVAAFWQGALEEAHAQFRAAVERCRPEHRNVHLLRYGQDPQAFCGLRLAYTSWLLGREDEARRERDAALAFAEASGHPFTLAATTAWAALLALDQHDEQRLRRHVGALGVGTTASVAEPIRALTETLLGHVDVLDGRGREGLGRIRRALGDARARSPTAPGQLAMHARILLEACLHAGDHRAGLAAADEALQMGGGTQLWEPEIRRLRAGSLAALGEETGAVETELQRAIEVARRQGARTVERRARDDLDRHRRWTC